MNEAKLDSTDQHLISLLRINARMAIVSIAKELGVSRTTALNRINKLEKQGIILGYTIKLKPGAQDQPVRLIMNIAVEAKDEANVIKSLHQYPEVFTIHHTTGHWDLIVEVKTDTLPKLNSLLGEIRLVDGIVKTETNLLLETIL